MTLPAIVVLIPAYNEAGSIGATIDAILTQTRPADHVVVIPNGCTDDTAAIARRYPVTVLELPRLEHRKSEALNTAWQRYGRDADIIICLDADTILPPNALADWELELERQPELGGSSSKFTAQGTGFLGRAQKAEFSAWADLCLQRGETRVVSGTGCALRNTALHQVVGRGDRTGPWSYASQTEDFELTYRLRELDWRCHVSPTVRAYTDSMKDLRSLWNQRMKWQAGTIEDLMVFGWNPLTWKDWLGQVAGIAAALVKVLAVYVTAVFALHGQLSLVWLWLILPLLLSAVEVKRAWRIPHREWKDVALAASLLPAEFYSWFRAGLCARSWIDAGISRITNTTIDRWESQHVAEGI
ncbi:glycosyltransferase [Arthrobacter phage SilentRX]|uniref:Glycosyltransferase n=1 Tax=Arthrobacter phage SilentRX TaxID=2836091 RepID=A0A8F3EBE8_9CAUD|nr:glycosyltransferase [Arthrobacter phage SilentRX]QWY82819.1 glycosyltransferase [Arthrobacter phage SilentRX]